MNQELALSDGPMTPSPFKSVHPVCPVLEMDAHIAFWNRLGFEQSFADTSTPGAVTYVGVTRDGIEQSVDLRLPDVQLAAQRRAGGT